MSAEVLDLCNRPATLAGPSLQPFLRNLKQSDSYRLLPDNPVRVKEDQMPESSPRLSLVRAADTLSHDHAGKLAARQWRKTRGVPLAIVKLAAAGSMGMGCILSGVVAAWIALVGAVLVIAVVAVMLSAMLGRRDSHSPFNRILLTICVINGRQPGDYGLAPSAPTKPGS
jgi:hypothetical protein